MFGPVYDALMTGFEVTGLRAWRRELLADVRGDVVELGAGTGANLPHYGPGVTSLVLVEPSPGMRRVLEARAAGIGAEVVDAVAEALPLPDDSADVVVFGLVLCSVRDPAAALAEARRVLRPGGRIVFLEHVVGRRPPLSWLHRALRPIWAALADGCQLDRDTGRRIEEAGFAFVRCERTWFPMLPGLVPAIRGVAVPVETDGRG